MLIAHKLNYVFVSHNGASSSCSRGALFDLVRLNFSLETELAYALIQYIMPAAKECL